MSDPAQSLRLDCRGYRCPVPVIRLEAALRGLAPGEQVTVFADDPIAKIDIPHFCREGGHEVEPAPAPAGASGFLVTRARPEAPPESG